MSPSLLFPGERVDDRFALTTRLEVRRGVEVWRAVQHPLKRQVVIKLLPQGDDPRRGSRFRREAEALGRLNHPACVDVYDHGEWGGWLYLVTAWIPGPLLEEELEHRWSVSDALDVTTDIAAGLAYAHARDVMHRDLSPARVVVRQEGRRMHAHLVDFATARTLDSLYDTTAGGSPVGTPGYMAPERIEGARGDPRGDVYAAGLILFELLTASHPFKRGRSIETLAAQADGTVPALDQVEPPVQVPAAVAWVVDRATRRDPEERLPDGAALHAALVACRVALADRRLWRVTPELRDGQLHVPAELAELPTESTLRRPGRPVAALVLVLAVAAGILFVLGCAGCLVAVTSL